MAIKNKVDFICEQVIDQKVFEGKYNDIIENINSKIQSKQTIGQKSLGFFDVLKNIQSSDYIKIKKIVKFLHEEKIDTLVIIAPQTICLQSQAIIDLTFSKNTNSKSIEVIYVNESFDGIDIVKLMQYLENKAFALNIISKNGDDLENLIIFRELISLLNNKVGKNNALKYIFATTNNNYGKLFNLVQNKKYNHLVLLDNTTARFLNYSVATLLPLACANIDIDEYITGAKEANEYYSNTKLSNNPAYKYSLVRYVFNKLDKKKDEKDIFSIENIIVFSPSYKKMADLFSMYLNSTSYRKYKGIRVETYVHPSDTKTFTNLFFEKQRKMFDTHFVVKNPYYDYNVAIMNDNEGDEFNYLMKYSYNKINKTIAKAIKDYHLSNQIPFIEIILEDISDRSIGWLIAFIHRASIMTSYLMNFDPFEEIGLKTYNIELTKKITELIGGNKND